MSFMQTHVNSYSKGTQNIPNQPQQQKISKQKVNDKYMGLFVLDVKQEESTL